jgi:hypothetical protein
MLIVRSTCALFAAVAFTLGAGCSGSLSTDVGPGGDGGSREGGGDDGGSREAGDDGGSSTDGAPEVDATAPALDAGADGAGGACSADGDCGPGRLCSFRIADGCAAVGVCFTPPPPGPMCEVYEAACTCDNKTINIACTIYPDGYASAPVLNTGDCELMVPTDAGNGASFVCGNVVCTDSQVCKSGSGGAYPGTTTYTCVDYPSQCASNRTCACVKPALGAQDCSTSNGDVTVDFDYP